jgi:hypothetical protein
VVDRGTLEVENTGIIRSFFCVPLTVSCADFLYCRFPLFVFGGCFVPAMLVISLYSCDVPGPSGRAI